MIKITAKIGQYDCGNFVYTKEDSKEFPSFEESTVLDFVKEAVENRNQASLRKGFGTGDFRLFFEVTEDGKKNYDLYFKVLDLEANPDKKCCEKCNRVLGHRDNFEYKICENCIDNLSDETGYCSLSCRLGYGCDGAC